MKRFGASLDGDEVGDLIVVEIGCSKLGSFVDNVVIVETPSVLFGDELSFLSIVKTVTSVPVIEKLLAYSEGLI